MLGLESYGHCSVSSLSPGRPNNAASRIARDFAGSRLLLTRRTNLLSCDMVGADHVAPKLDLALEQCARGLRRFLILRV